MSSGDRDAGGMKPGAMRLKLYTLEILFDNACGLERRDRFFTKQAILADVNGSVPMVGVAEVRQDLRSSTVGVRGE